VEQACQSSRKKEAIHKTTSSKVSAPVGRFQKKDIKRQLGSGREKRLPILKNLQAQRIKKNQNNGVGEGERRGREMEKEEIKGRNVSSYHKQLKDRYC